MNEAVILKKKICLLGMFGVGKTSLVRRFVDNIFDDSYLSTIGVKVSQKILPPVSVSDGRMVQFHFVIWDIEGFGKAGPALKNYYTGASGALIVSDLTRPETIEKIPEIAGFFREINPDARILLAGNKNDLTGEKSKSFELMDSIAASGKHKFYLTSAKTGENVENIFWQLQELLVNVKYE
ncbi:MAG: Rab family GTPase [Calditrichaceae bacterium]